MKKRLIPLAWLLLALPLNVSAATLVKSKISSVTVFTSGAQVNRKATIELGRGETELKFTDLSPFINAQSIQVRCNSKITLLSVNQQSNYLSGNQEPKELTTMKNKRDDFDLKKKEQEATLQTVNDELSFLEANKSIGGKNQELNLANLKATGSYYRERNLALRKQKIILDKDIKGLGDSINAMNNQIQQYSVKQQNEASNEIVVKVSAKEATNCKFELSYVVNNAGWYPSYDIRANGVTDPIDLIYKANIHQNTKETWNHVNLTLSTGNPNAGGVAPILSPYTIGEEKDNMVLLKDAAPSRMLMKSKMVAMSFENDSTAEDDVELPEVSQESSQTTVEFEIKTPYSIPSGKSDVTVNIENYSLPVQYEYYCVPKLDKDAFLMANISNWEKLNLMSGEANLFFENTFVGKSRIDAQQQTDTMRLSFGRDKGIVVKRELIKNYNESKFIGSKKTVTKGWEITARNNKSNDINIKIYDQVPISTNSGFDVSTEELSGGKQNSKTGEVMWNLTLKPQEKKTLDLKYKVKAPKDGNWDPIE